MATKMSIARFALLLAIALALPATPATIAAADIAPERVQLRIELYGFAGFHVLTDRTTLDTSADRYSIASDIDTRGIAAVFVDLNSHSTVQGRIAANAAYPEAYRGEVRRNGVDRRYRIDYRPDGPVASELAPPAATWRSQGAPGELRGTVDQLTAYFLLERQLARTGSCNLTVPVFDGHGRYNLRFLDAAEQAPPRGPAKSFAGPTHVCAAVRKDVPGFAGNGDQAEGTYRSGRVWYARIGPDGHMIPVQMEFDTEFGIVRGYLAEVKGHGIDRRFIE
jgi:hypothetical protein